MALKPERQIEIAKQLRMASTWVDGPRQIVLEELASELGDEPDPGEVAVEAPVKKSGK